MADIIPPLAAIWQPELRGSGIGAANIADQSRAVEGWPQCGFEG